MSIKKLLNEGLNRYNVFEAMASRYTLTENPEDFGDANVQCLNPYAVVAMLDDELKRIETNKQADKKSDKTMKRQAKAGSLDIIDAVMTQQNIRNVKNSDIEKYIADLAEYISLPPESIMDNTNPKMNKTDIGYNQMTVSTGLPAIVGIVWDKNDEVFKSISTCPGAGECVIGCYARKAFYSFDEDKTIKLARRLNLLYNNANEYTKMILSELRPLAEKLEMSSVGDDRMKLVIRWNDAGDFFAKKYVNVAVEVTKTLISEGYDVMSYAYTKTGKYAIELDQNDDFVINFSSDAHTKQKKEVDDYDTDKKMKRATKVEKELWKQFFIPKGSSWVKDIKGKAAFRGEDRNERLKNAEELKDVIFDKYGASDGITRESLIYTYQIPRELQEKNKYNVIVLPTGDSDIGAQRTDIKMSYLLAH